MKTVMMATAVALLAACTTEAPHEHAHSEAEHHEDVARGAHGGRLFSGAGFDLELAIEEDDGPPVFAAWVTTRDGEPVPPGDVSLTVALERFAGRRDEVTFSPAGNHLRSDTEVREPHSFAATVVLAAPGGEEHWSYEQTEYRVALTPEAVERAGIVTALAGPARIDVRVESPGEVHMNGERMLVVRPRFPGVVAHMHRQLGDAVSRGDTLALVQSNTSLTEYAITAPMRGTIVARSGMVGAAVDAATTLYTLADLSSVWVDFAIYPQHIGVVERGQEVTVRAAARDGLVAGGQVAYVGPLLEQDTRVSYGRVVLPNPGGEWQPGLYVTVSAVTERAAVEVAVPERAIVRSPFGPAVFVADGSAFEIQPVTTGRSDGTTTEVAAGIDAGTRVVVDNAYILKAELGRSEATHDH